VSTLRSFGCFSPCPLLPPLNFQWRSSSCRVHVAWNVAIQSWVVQYLLIIVCGTITIALLTFRTPFFYEYTLTLRVFRHTDMKFASFGPGSLPSLSLLLTIQWLYGVSYAVNLFGSCSLCRAAAPVCWRARASGTSIHGTHLNCPGRCDGPKHGHPC
jgi:hypothetical protein